MKTIILASLVGLLVLIVACAAPTVPPAEPAPPIPTLPAPTAPSPAPTPEVEPAPQVFVGSVNSDIYHYPDCKWAKKINPENEIWFSSVEDAKAHGYRACKVCKPPG